MQMIGNHDNLYDIEQAHKNGLVKIMPSILSRREFSIWEYKFQGDKVVLCHYPMYAWNASFRGRPHLFGHIHSSPYDIKVCQRGSYDVGVDNNHFTPILLTDAIISATENHTCLGTPT